MNLISKIGIGAFCLFMTGCLSTDDGSFGRTVNLNIQNAFTLQNEKEYTVGDTIFFELRFSRYLPEEGYDNLLDIYETTRSEKFSFSFDFLKFSEFEGGFRSVNLSPEFVIAEEKDFDTFFYNTNYGTVATLNTDREIYESRVGIVLQEEGIFQFDFNNSYIRNPFNYDEIQVSIFHNFPSANTPDLEFNVESE